MIEFYTVEARGVGRPDYSPIVSVGKSVLDSNQVNWYAVQEGNIPGLTAVDWINYAVPDNCMLHICAGLVCVNALELHRVGLNFSPALLGTIAYYQLLALPLNPSATYEITAGSLVYARLYNDNAAGRYFTISLTGFLERVL